MVYSKLNLVEGNTLSVSALNHMETQYDEFLTDYNAHLHDSRYYTESECGSRFFNSGNDGSGSGLDADTVDGYTAAQIEAEAVPRGTIAIWSGSQASIPAGWVLCNGVNSTPDLRDKFVVGAGDSYAKGATGGYASRTPTGSVTIATHTLTKAELPVHYHLYDDIYYNCSWRGMGYSPITGEASSAHNRETSSTGGGDPHGHSGSTIAFDSYDNRPPYYALCWIMRELT
ncbi:MAG: hypothetical protein WC145_11975 [Aliarcobacter sp.]